MAAGAEGEAGTRRTDHQSLIWIEHISPSPNVCCSWRTCQRQRQSQILLAMRMTGLTCQDEPGAEMCCWVLIYSFVLEHLEYSVNVVTLPYL